jgi:transglutaminase-like putative cysteine protease
VTVSPTVLPRERAWEEVRAGLRTSSLIEARGYALPSPRLPAHPDVTAYARPSFPPGRALTDCALDLSSRIHRDFRYVSGSSTVRSSVADLLASGEGVCQDFAHLAVAGLRSMGLAARYVSGYLETRPPPGRPRVVGADASHAWVSVFTGDDWFDLDPTNDRAVDRSFVELAHGRDYADVPPLRGVIFSDGGDSVLRVAVDMIRLDPPA